MTLRHYAGHDSAPPATPDERQTLADLSIGEMLAILKIAGTFESARAADVLAEGSGGTLAPLREAFMRLTVRGLIRANGPKYALTMRGQFVGSALIASIEAA